MSYKIYNYKTYDLTELSYQKPVKSARGNVYSCNVDKPFDVLFQSKEIVLPSDVEVSEREAFIHVDTVNSDFGDFIRRMDEHNINYIFNNCTEWFERELPYEAIKDFYIANIREDGTVRMPIPVVKRRLDIKIYDSAKNILDETALVAGTRIVIVFRVNGLKFYKKECVMDMDVVQILVMRPTVVEKVVEEAKKVAEVETTTSTPSLQKKEEMEVFNRIRFREELKNKKEVARVAFEEAEKAQREADNLKNRAMELAKELKKMEEDYYREDDDADDIQDDE